MTARLIDITPSLPANLANEDCVETLERLLGLAKKGDIVTLAVAAICRDNEALWSICEADKSARHLALLGAMRLVERKLMNELDTASDD